MTTDSKFWKIFTQVSSFILVFGFLKIIVFYKAFNIPAQYFTSVTELGMLVSDNILIIALIYFGILLLVFLNNSSSHETPIDETKLRKPKKIIIDRNIIPFFTIILLICYLLMIILLNYDDAITMLSFLPFIIFAYTFIFKSSVIEKHFKSFFDFVLICFFVCIVAGLGVITSFEIRAIKEGKFNGSIIYLENMEITTSDTLLFVGKTENYVFLYNKNKKYADIIPTSEIKRIRIKQK